MLGLLRWLWDWTSTPAPEPVVEGTVTLALKHTVTGSPQHTVTTTHSVRSLRWEQQA